MIKTTDWTDLMSTTVDCLVKADNKYYFDGLEFYSMPHGKCFLHALTEISNFDYNDINALSDLIFQYDRLEKM